MPVLLQVDGRRTLVDHCRSAVDYVVEHQVPLSASQLRRLVELLVAAERWSDAAEDVDEGRLEAPWIDRTGSMPLPK